MATAGPPNLLMLTTQVKTLVNQDLRDICRAEGQPVSGVKNQLQERVISLLHRYADNNDQASLVRLQHLIANRGKSVPAYTSSQALLGASAMNSNYPPPLYNTSHVMANGQAPNGIKTRKRFYSSITSMVWTRQAKNKAPAACIDMTAAESSSSSETVPIQNFRGDPFFDLQDPVSKTQLLPIVQNHRHSVKLAIDLNSTNVDRLRADNSMRVMLFCSSDDFGQIQAVRSTISFPQQIEVKVNDAAFVANFKGLKNKPGSTKPADITPFLRKSQSHQTNTVDITYAQTMRKFFAVAILVKKRSVGELAERIKSHFVITKSTVLKEMQSKAEDPDIVATSTVMSLKDPVSYTRINLPCRSSACMHNQCFDAEAFLQLQEQAPTWTCPICSKHIGFDALAVDQYVQEILAQTPTSVDQVTIEPNGQWSYSNSTNNGTSSGDRQANGAHDDEDDEDSDDLVEITDPRIKSIKSEAPATPFSMARTPPLGSRETSTHSAPSAARAGQKRKSEVIDLTLSDDDEPPRPAKRQAYNTPNSLPDQARNGYANQSSFCQSRIPLTDNSSLPSAAQINLPGQSRNGNLPSLNGLPAFPTPSLSLNPYTTVPPLQLPAPQPRQTSNVPAFNWTNSSSPAPYSAPYSPYQLPSISHNQQQPSVFTPGYLPQSSPQLPTGFPISQHSPAPSVGQAFDPPAQSAHDQR